MQENIKKYLQELRENKKKHRRAKFLAALCSICILVGIACSLILPGYAAGDVDDDEQVNQELQIGMSASQTTALTGEYLTVHLYSTYSKANNTGENVTVKIDMNKLPEGISLPDFIDDKLEYTQGEGEDKQTILLEIKKDENDNSYIFYEQPAGSTLDVYINFLCEKGIMPQETTIKLQVGEITGLEDETQVNNTTQNDGVIDLTWTAKHSWDPVTKTVDNSTIAVTGENKLSGDLTYTIQANSANVDGIGKIWTKYVTVADTLVLPTGITLPSGAKISDDKTAIVTADGTQTILSFTNLADVSGSVISLQIVNNQTVSYVVQVPNTHKNESGVLTAEQDNLSLTMLLKSELLTLETDYAPAATDFIINSVVFKSEPCQEYEVTETTATATTQPVQKDETYELKKVGEYVDNSIKGVVAGGEVKYTITLKNTGEVPLTVKKEDGTSEVVTDILSQYYYLTEAQKAALPTNVTYDEEKNQITWIPSEEKIPVGESVTLTFNVTVKDDTMLQEQGIPLLKNGDKIQNTATYKKNGPSSLTVDVIYRRPVLTIEKTSQDEDDDGVNEVHNGEKITYTIKVKGDEELDGTGTTTIEDTLQEGLTFESVTIGGTKYTTSSECQLHGSTEGCKSEHKCIFTIDGQDLSFKIGCLKANEEITISYVCKVDTDLLVYSKTQIENTATIPDGSSNNIIGVDYPIKLLKTVDKDTSEAYASGTVFTYKVVVSNDLENPSVGKDLVLEDQLPEGLLPYGYDLIQTNKSTNETQTIKWEDFVGGTYDTTTYSYTTTIDGIVTNVENVSGKVKLSWNVGELAAGGSYEISYQAQMTLTEEQIESGRSYKFTNVATVDGITSEITVTGGVKVGSLKISKQFLKYIGDRVYKGGRYKDTDPQMNVEFVLSGVDPKGNQIVFEDGSTELSVKVKDFTVHSNEVTFIYEFDKLPVGTYTLQEKNYELDGHTVYPNIGVTYNGENTYFGDTAVFEIGENVQTTIWDNNCCYTDLTVNLQKSVFEIAQETTNADGSKTWTSLPDKYLFSTDISDNVKNYVVYNITVSATGYGTLQMPEGIVDKLPSGMKYVGIYNKADYTNSSNFVSSTDGSVKTLELNDSTQMNDCLSVEYWPTSYLGSCPITATYDETVNEVTFAISNDGKSTLPAGMAYSFLVLCEVDSSVVAGQQLTNTIELKTTNAVGLTGSEEYQTVNTPCDANQNNGMATLVAENNGELTIQASVTVVPENTIVPGIEKKAASYLLPGQKEGSETAFTETTNIQSNAAVKWEVTLYNNGTQDMVNYTVEDVVTSDFHLMNQTEATRFGITAPFNFQLYDYNGNAVGDAINISAEVWNTVADSTQVNEYEFDLTGEEFTIPAGYYAILTVYTNNTTVKNQIYKNTATILPTQSFVANKVKHGELVKDTDGTYIGVSATDQVYALGEYASISWKTITEKENESNTAKGTWSKNYITLGLDSTNEVTYTNNIKNISKNNFNQFVIIDLMPKKNDTGVINQNDVRGSEFRVLYNGNMKVQVLDGSGNVVEEPDFVVEFSAKTGFTQKDFAGESSTNWHSEWTESDYSFRVILEEDFYLQPQHTLVITYDGIIESSATPGAIAWNSFGYHYCSGSDSTSMLAEPPKVGVMIPTVPIIQKEVVDLFDCVQEMDSNIEFTFVLWEEQSSGNGAEFVRLCDFKVCQGGYQELSDLKDKDNNSVKLINGTTYKITEDVDSMPEDYTLIGIGEKGSALSESYTFTYYDNKDINILARNRLDSSVLELPAAGGISARVFRLLGVVIVLSGILACSILVICKGNKR